MVKIPSFTIDHTKLKSGLYVSRKDKKDNITVTTFDMRITEPNKEPVIDMPALHTIEHLCATYLRNSKDKDDIIYFGPMGCRTGCYIVMFGDLDSIDIYPMVIEMADYVITYEGDIPGATPEECGNYSEQNLNMAKYYMIQFRDRLFEYQRFKYPD